MDQEAHQARDQPRSRSVLHVCGAFEARSQPWIYDLVSSHISYSPRVACAVREGQGFHHRGDIDVTEALPAWRRGSSVWLYQKVGGFVIPFAAPPNDWKRALRTLGPADVVHAHFGPAGWRVVDAGLSPVVTTFYGYDATEKNFVRKWARAYAQLFRRGEAFVAEGPTMRERLVGLGAPIDRVDIVPLIADLEGLTWRAPVGDESVRVLMAGRFVEKKGFVDGVRAFADALGLGLAARLLIMGSGPEEAAIRSTVQACGIREHVEFVPPASRDRYREVMASCQVFLQPSKTAKSGDAEGGAPTTLLDAQALGCVIVTTNHSDIPFLVDSEAAFICDEGNVTALADRLTRALTAQDEWAERSRLGRRHVERQHGRSEVVKRLEGVYDALIR